MKRIALLLLTTALAACQSQNPYTTTKRTFQRKTV